MPFKNYSPDTHEQDDVMLEELKDELYHLIVWNDDVNSFDHVINTLIEICHHEPHQAEQCTWLIHYKGKCDVQKGSFDKLKKMAEAIIDRGINATIE
jgi:ATP-dependent Clp protease adaptor protein ClpS